MKKGLTKWRKKNDKFLAFFGNAVKWRGHSYFSLIGKLVGRDIYFADDFSLFFICSFLMVDFGTPVSQKLMDRSSPKFQDW